jgi:hypothetical protein
VRNWFQTLLSKCNSHRYTPAAKAMSLASVCTAARLPTAANQRLKGNRAIKGA